MQNNKNAKEIDKNLTAEHNNNYVDMYSQFL